MAGKRLDLSGKTFNNITVISPSGTSPRGAALWNCHCNRCGRNFVVDGSRLLGKRPKKDCGCSYKERTADISGQQLGGVDVIRRVGTDKHGNVLYLCRCRICGAEKTMPACTIKAIPQSCGCKVGCKSMNAEKLAEISRLGVEKSNVNGCNIYIAAKTEAMANSISGLRWVRIQRVNGREYIKAMFRIAGKRYYRGGFTSPESAYAWAKAAHDQALLDANIPAPEKKKKKEKGK